MNLIPNEKIASKILKNVMNEDITSITRFTTGNQHYVYDVILADGRNIVLRMTKALDKEATRGALVWNKKLRELGLPLPKVFNTDLNGEFPFIIMERLPGCDLGYVVNDLSQNELQVIARQLIKFQKSVAQLPSNEKFGYAVEAELAPFYLWKDVLKASLKRSEIRIQNVGFVSHDCVKKVSVLLEDCSDLLMQITATPFLHDITTKNVIISNGKLSGIVDVDSLCFGDPLFQVALTRMGLLSDKSNTEYIDFLLDEFGPYSPELLRLYTAECCVGFLSELGQQFNGNIALASQERKEHLEGILDSLLNK